jgi:hypothetical protein
VDLELLKTQATHPFETSGTSYPAAMHRRTPASKTQKIARSLQFFRITSAAVVLTSVSNSAVAYFELCVCLIPFVVALYLQV